MRLLALLSLAASVLCNAIAPASAQLFETKVRHAILIDYESGSVLFQKAADTPMPPASMAKLMTAAVVFADIRAGRLTMEDRFQVSENAWRKGGSSAGGSTMFLEPGSEVALSDLIRGVIVQSGNDAAIAVAEGISGTEEAFARRMNEEAKRIGLGASTFRNSTGLPHAEQSVTARDLARLATTIIRDYPEFYPIYGERAFTWNDITQRNRNPLLTMDIGADGMKTGQTAASGYGLVGSAVQNGQRLIVVINGAESEAQRAEEARKLLEWGFRAFRRVSLFGPEEIVAEAAVFGGREPTVGLRSGEPVSILLPEQRLEEVTARVVYDGPVPAPVAEGQEIASLKIAVGEEVVATAPLFAATGVPSGSVTQRARDGLADLLFGWW